MAAYGWGGDVGLERWLFDEPYAFDFFQAVHLLQVWSRSANPPNGVQPAADAVRFRASFSLSSAPSEILALQASSSGAPPEMTVAFLGTGGVDGPLPTSFTEAILERLKHHDDAAAAFLDIFHHRLIALRYRMQQLHSPALTSVPPEQTAMARYLFSVMGLGLESVSTQVTAPAALMRYAGLLATQPRSAQGLAVLLSDYFQMPVHVEQFVGEWCALQPDQQASLGRSGQNNRIGQTAIIGSRVWIQDAGIQLRIGPLDFYALAGFLPDGKAHRTLAELVRIYAGTTVTVGLRLVIQPQDVQPTRLGVSRLGWTSWLHGQPATQPDDQVRLRLHTVPRPARGYA